MAASPLSLARPVPARAVHLHITPRPSNLAQSRSILRLLQQDFGEVEFYKNLKYERIPKPTAALVIFREETAARKLLKASPLRFMMSWKGGRDTLDQDVRQSQEGGSGQADAHSGQVDEDMHGHTESERRRVASLARQRQQQRLYGQTSIPQDDTPRMPFEPKPDDGSDALTQEFQIQINTSTYNHRDHINMNPYNGPFAIDSKSAVQEDLAKRVPLLGLSVIDLKKMQKPWRVLAWQRKREMETRLPLKELYERGRLERERVRGTAG